MSTASLLDGLLLIALQRHLRYLSDNNDPKVVEEDACTGFEGDEGPGFSSPISIAYDLPTEVVPEMDIDEAVQHSDLTRDSPINTLPPEILGLIFHNLARCTAPHTPEWTKWPSIGLVCRYWRQTVLCTPELWTTVCARSKGHDDAQSNQLLLLRLARSGVLPLSASISSKDDMFIEAVLANLWRIRELSLDVVPAALERPGVLAEATQLECLRFGSSPESAHSSHKILASDAIWDLPSLQTVVSVGSSMWANFSCQNLRHLIITSYTFRTAAIQPLRRIISANSALEDIVLSGGFEIGPEGLEAMLTRESQSQLIAMPALKRLYVACNSSLAMILNSMLVLGPSPSIRYYRFRYHEVRNILPLLFPSRAKFTAHSLYINMASWGVAFAANDDSVLYLAPSGHMGAALEILPHAIHASDVRRLHLMNTHSFTRDSAAGLTFLPQVTSLLVSFSSDRAVIDWLKGMLAHNLFPALQELCVVARDAVLGVALLRFLHLRKNAGKPIRTLRFIRGSDQAKPSSFDNWRRSQWKFARLVEQVVFDDGDLPDYMRADLPEICSHPFPVDGTWSPEIKYW